MSERVRVIDFLDEFVEALRKDLLRGEAKQGDTWLHRPRKGQEQRVRHYLNDMFDRFEYADSPVRWESVAGETLVCWIRENHPELFSE